MKAIYAVEGLLLLLLGVIALFLHAYPRRLGGHSHTGPSNQQPALGPTDKPEKSNPVTFRASPKSPNHALQRTAPCVTAPASAAALPPTMQVPRRTPRSLSLGSLGP